MSVDGPEGGQQQARPASGGGQADATRGHWQAAFEAQQRLNQALLRQRGASEAGSPQALALQRQRAQALQRLSHELRSSLTALILTLHTDQPEPLAAVEALAQAALATTERALQEAAQLLDAGRGPQQG